VPKGPRYRWVVLGAGAAAQTTYSAITVGLPAIAPQLRTHYDLTLGQIGVVLGAAGAGMIFGLFPWGLATDRLGERTVVTLGLALAGLALFGVASSDDYGVLVGGLAVFGLCGCAVIAGSGRAVAGWFPREERGLALGIRQTAVPLGGALAAIGLPLIANSGGIRAAFITLGSGCLLGAACALALIRDAPSSPHSGETSIDTSPLRSGPVWVLSLGTASFLTAQIAVLGYLVLFLHDERGVSTHAAAALLALTNLLGGAARIAAGRLSDRMHARIRPLRMLGAASAITTALVAALVNAPLGLLVPVFVVCGVFASSWNGLAFTAAAEAFPRNRSGAVLGFQQTLFAIFVTVSPIIFAALVESTSWRVAFALSAVGPAVGVAVLRRLAEPRLAGRSAAQSRETSAPPPVAP
jgi:MFS family permease